MKRELGKMLKYFLLIFLINSFRDVCFRIMSGKNRKDQMNNMLLNAYMIRYIENFEKLIRNYYSNKSLV